MFCCNIFYRLVQSAKAKQLSREALLNLIHPELSSKRCLSEPLFFTEPALSVASLIIFASKEQTYYSVQAALALYKFQPQIKGILQLRWRWVTLINSNAVQYQQYCRPTSGLLHQIKMYVSARTTNKIALKSNENTCQNLESMVWQELFFVL